MFEHADYIHDGCQIVDGEDFRCDDCAPRRTPNPPTLAGAYRHAVERVANTGDPDRVVMVTACGIRRPFARRLVAAYLRPRPPVDCPYCRGERSRFEVGR